MNLEHELAILDSDTGEDLAELEAAFVEIAASYTERKGLTWTAWRTVGVPATVLTQAGIPRR